MEILADLDFIMNQNLAAEYLLRGPAYTIIKNGQVVWCGGLVMLWPGMAEAWGVPSMSLQDCPLGFHRLVVTVLRELIETMKLRRVQCTIASVFGISQRWVQALGFQHEGDMAMYGPDGADHKRYALVKGQSCI